MAKRSKNTGASLMVRAKQSMWMSFDGDEPQVA
jgi:hypothetical protein